MRDGSPPEFSKHATCFSAFDAGANNMNDCYGLDYRNSTEASIIDFLESVIQGQLQYPTYTWLSNVSHERRRSLMGRPGSLRPIRRATTTPPS